MIPETKNFILSLSFLKVKPVGKIVVSEKYLPENFAGKKDKSAIEQKKKKTDSKTSLCEDVEMSSNESNSDAESDDKPDVDDCSNSSEDEVKPIAGKKLQKKLNDQRFTIETTVTVESSKKRGKKGGAANTSKALPEPTSMKKRKSMKVDCDLE